MLQVSRAVGEGMVSVIGADQEILDQDILDLQTFGQACVQGFKQGSRTLPSGGRWSFW